MNPWNWYLRRAWWLRLLLALPAALAVLAALYVVARALQYSSAEGDAGLFVPSGANVVLRVRGLEGHWRRIQGTAAWRTIDRKVLRDPALRAVLNGELQGAGIPTLDDLEDVRKSRTYSADLLFRAAGRDALLALRVGDTWKKTPWCAATRLRLSDFLLVPFARWVMPSERVSGYSCLKVRQGGMDLFVSVQGKVAVIGNDRALLAEALKARGGRSAPVRPVALHVTFEGSRALLDLRRQFGENGLFPLVRVESVRTAEVTADIAGHAVFADAVLDGAEPARPEPPPAEYAALSPAYASGFFLCGAGAREVFAWLKGQAASGSSRDFREAVKMFDEAGFTSGFLPLIGLGMGVLLGSEERDGRLHPSIAIVVPSREPAKAVEAMTSVIRRCLPKESPTEPQRRRVNDVEMVSWRWPGGVLWGPVPLNNVFQPCCAALQDAVVLGNSEGFTEAVIERMAGRGEGLLDQGAYRRVMERLRAYGMRTDPPPPGVFLFLPSFRESLDGLMLILAHQAVDGAQDGAKVRAEIDADLRRQGRTAADKEIVELFNVVMMRRKLEKEELFRRNLRALDAAEWAAVQAIPSEKGMSIRAVAEFR